MLAHRQYLHARAFSGVPFRKGHQKHPYVAQLRKGTPEDKTGSTNMVSSRTSTSSSIVGSGVGTDDVSHWQSLLATFIVDSASALGHPYFYLLRTNTKWSLCLLSGLSPIHYGSLLLECQLVRIRKNPADGSRQVLFDRTKWIAFLERYELCGVNGKGCCAEFTNGKIFHAAMFGDNQCDPGTYTRMPFTSCWKSTPGKMGKVWDEDEDDEQ